MRDPSYTLTLDAAGRVPEARYVPSPHCDARPLGEAIRLIVVHGISLPPGEFGGDAIQRLFTGRLECDRHPYVPSVFGLRVSAHFLIRRPGTLLQFVPCGLRAWHAGESEWDGRRQCNDFSIGIELEGTDITPYFEAQYRQLERLVALLSVHFPIAAVVGHSDIAPARKTDPGPAFDWTYFRTKLAAAAH